jgi:hypothetical protein
MISPLVAISQVRPFGHLTDIEACVGSPVMGATVIGAARRRSAPTFVPRPLWRSDERRVHLAALSQLASGYRLVRDSTSVVTLVRAINSGGRDFRGHDSVR